MTNTIKTDNFLAVISENRDVNWVTRSTYSGDSGLKEIYQRFKFYISEEYKDNVNSKPNKLSFVFICDKVNKSKLWWLLFAYIATAMEKDQDKLLSILSKDSPEDPMEYFFNLFHTHTGVHLAPFVFVDKDTKLTLGELVEIQKATTNTDAHLYAI